MKLVLVGGGGFRTPLILRALLERPAPRLITEVVLVDLDPGRLASMAAVIDQLNRAAVDHGAAPGPTVSTTTDLDAALDGADFVFTAIRVGGLAGRVADERVALDLGLLGQETTGPGGVAYGLRTVPVMVDLARRIADRAPAAWTINFTNPAGMITQAMRSVLGERVIGICDSPMGLARRARRALGLAPSATGDYAGLNHLGWLHSIDDGGVDRLPELLARPEALATMEEGRIFGVDWLQTLGAIPNEYLYYFYFTRDAIAATTARTRGEFLLDQQSDFFAAVARDRSRALARWDQVRTERNETYMASAGVATARHADDVDHGGYEDVAVAVMEALGGGEPAALILNVANRGPGRSRPAVDGLADDAVVEVPCLVTADGARPERSGLVLPGSEIGLVQQIKAVETLVIEAARSGSPTAAIGAFALHPLVDSVTVARQLYAGYRDRIPEFALVMPDLTSWQP